MSYADERFKIACRDIINNGTNTKGEDVRAKWPDGTYAYTLKKFGVLDEYDLRKEFPAITLRKIALKSCMDEILWIMQRKSNNIKDLKPAIWDEWADENGSIGLAYGYQVGQPFIFKKPATKAEFDLIESRCVNFFGEGKGLPSLSSSPRIKMIELDQMDSVLYQLKYEPFSRRIMINTWNFQDLSDMRLQPCAYNFIFNVEKDNSDNSKLILNGMLVQRSQDMLAANGWNVCQYAIFLMMVAQTVGMTPGKLTHVIADCHIYDKHVPLVEELLEREEYPAPKVSLNPNVTNFYEFTTNDLIVEDYKYGPQIKDIPIAI
ncbi:MAG: thymidylate synthase [Clostridia bacterium]|nr:thymidylate synthase [Clostridia bacterium]